MLTVNKKCRQKGMTLLELVLAMTTLSIVLLGMTGFVNGFLRFSRISHQSQNMQQDMNFVFRKMEYLLMNLQNEKDLRYRLTITPDPAIPQAAKLEMLVQDATNPADVQTLCKLKADYSKERDETNPANPNFMEIACPANAQPDRFLINGFKPWARIRDFNEDGRINDLDKARRDECLADFRKCVSSDCDNYVSNGTYTFNFNDPSLATGLTSVCLNKSVIPLLELNRDRSLLYFSMQPYRVNKKSGMRERKLPGITKVIALTPEEAGA